MNAGIVRSAGVRFDRRVTRSHVYRGVSLSLLLREGRSELEGVRVLTLVRWVQGIGPRKAQRILRDLPQHYPLSALSEDQREVLTERLAVAERTLFARKSSPYHPNQEANDG